MCIMTIAHIQRKSHIIWIFFSTFRKNLLPSFPYHKGLLLKGRICSLPFQLPHRTSALKGYHKGLLLMERICSLWEQILSFKHSPHFEKGHHENQCSFQYPPFDFRNNFSVLAKLLRMNTWSTQSHKFKPVLSVDYFCKEFGPRSAPTKRQFKLFTTLMAFMNKSFEKDFYGYKIKWCVFRFEE